MPDWMGNRTRQANRYDRDQATGGYAAPLQQKPKQPRRDGQGSADPYASPPPDESARMLRGAFQAGINGDDGALQSFPNTPFGQRLRQEFMRGRQQRSKPQRGLGFSGLDRG